MGTHQILVPRPLFFLNTVHETKTIFQLIWSNPGGINIQGQIQVHASWISSLKKAVVIRGGGLLKYDLGRDVPLRLEK